MNHDWRAALRKVFLIPKSAELSAAVRALSPFERIVFAALVLLLAGSTIVLVNAVNRLITVEVPARGGSTVEGIVGTPRFINPLLAISDADRDLTALVYSGLLRATPDGLVPDLAENYAVSDNGLTYTFVIREDARFHDGEPVTADDVLFTVRAAQDPALKSPKRPNWDGIVAEKVSDREVRFTLRQPYAPFLENATLGILPRHVWEGTDAEQFPFSQRNIEPVGSGPYRVVSVSRNSSGIPESYELAPFSRFTLGNPYLAHIALRFYASEADLLSAYLSGDVDAVNSVTPEKVSSLARRGGAVIREPLPRIFGVFFNQNQNIVFAEKAVRAALEAGVDKERVVADVLFGYGTPVRRPVPPGTFEEEDSPAERGGPERMSAALEAAGWKRAEDGVFEKKVNRKVQRLEFSIATSNAPELKAAGEILKADWEAGGAKVDLKVFDVGDLNQNVIRPRKYDALLFGEIVGREPDLFAFWHSSQRNDPGLNIALYANITADKLLEKARATADWRERTDANEKFEAEVAKDVPAIFIYTPDFVYVVPAALKGVRVGSVMTASERFANVYEWYTETDRVWHFFTRT